MKICRHCSHSKPPLGARKCREAAARAGFGGTLHLVCYGHDKPTRADIGGKSQIEGSFHPQHGIRVYQYGPHAKGYKFPRNEEEQFRVFLHELGHFRRHIKGLPQGEGTRDEQKAEQYANRYASEEAKALDG